MEGSHATHRQFAAGKAARGHEAKSYHRRVPVLDSSSGVEQLFSKIRRSLVEHANASKETDRRNAIVMGDGHSTAEKEEIIRDARKICVSLLQSGASRPRTRQRFDSGKTGTKVKEGSFAHWNRARKTAVQQAVQDL